MIQHEVLKGEVMSRIVSNDSRKISRVSRALDRQVATQQIAATNRLAEAIEWHAKVLDATDDTLRDLMVIFSGNRRLNEFNKKQRS
jgi:hypothetical protein